MNMDPVLKSFLESEIDFFLGDLQQSNFHPLQRKLISIFSNYFDLKTLSSRDLTRWIFGSGVKEDLFSQQFKPLTQYNIISLKFAIDNTPDSQVPPALKILLIAELEIFAMADNAFSDTSTNREYRLYDTLSRISTKDRPDLLPANHKVLSMDAMGTLISRNKDKDLIGYAVRNQNPLTQTGIAFANSWIHKNIRDARSKSYLKLVIEEHTNYYIELKQRLKHLGIYFTFEKNLYHPNWNGDSNNRISFLRKESYGLDAVSGDIVRNPASHHIEYDKSRMGSVSNRYHYTILLDQKTNFYQSNQNPNMRVRDPPRQKYFGQPIQFTQESIEDMNSLRAAKIAYSQGLPSPHWGDKNHRWYNPEGIRRFLWNKLQVGIHGWNWLDSQAFENGPPDTFQPQEYLDAL